MTEFYNLTVISIINTSVTTDLSPEKKKNIKEAHKVAHAEEKANAQGHFDAREEGHNKYQDNRKKKDDAMKGTKVSKKNISSGFDVKI